MHLRPKNLACGAALIGGWLALCGFTSRQTDAELVKAAEIAAPQLRSGVFGGGPFYHDADHVMPAMRASGFETMILWTLHVSENGDLVYNDAVLISDGRYVGEASWPAKVASLKQAPTSVQRVEWCVGSAGVADFEHVQRLIEAGGAAAGGILQRNFAALKATFPSVDAVSYDDESNYDAASSLALSLMLGGETFHVTLTPYRDAEFWRVLFRDANARHPGLIDRVYLQAYAGGAGNDPKVWNTYFDGIKVDVGLWGKHGSDCRDGLAPERIGQKISAWRPDISGGWLWLLDDLIDCQSKYPIGDYVRELHK